MPTNVVNSIECSAGLRQVIATAIVYDIKCKFSLLLLLSYIIVTDSYFSALANFFSRLRSDVRN
jgi:hypothetical protein